AWLEFADTLLDVEEATRQVNAAQFQYADFLDRMRGEATAVGRSGFSEEFRRIRDSVVQAVANANELARAAGRQGASERELGLIHMWAANQIKAAIAQLESSAPSLV